jgi:hypothetical protein
MQRLGWNFQLMSVFEFRYQPDNVIRKFVFIHYDQRRNIRSRKAARSIWRGHTDAPGRQGLDDLQRTPANVLVRINAD